MKSSLCPYCHAQSVLYGFMPCFVGGVGLQLLYYWYRLRPVRKFQSYLHDPNMEAGQGQGTAETKDLRRVYKFSSAGMKYRTLEWLHEE